MDACNLSVCGNGTLEAPAEQCEGTSQSIACSALNPRYRSGDAYCRDDCYWEINVCKEYLCGDGEIETDQGELCDGNQVACTELDPDQYAAGTASCGGSCTYWNVGTCTQRPRCGNSIPEPQNDEICDGDTNECVEIDPDRFTGGTAICNATCDGWETSKCITEDSCGNGSVAPPEICDGDTADCSKIDTNYESGTAYCNETCDGWLTHECVRKEFCGDGIRNNDELCDSERKLCSEIDSQYVEGYADCAGSCDHWKTGNCVVGDQPQQVTVNESGNVAKDEWIHFGPFQASTAEFQVVMTGSGTSLEGRVNHFIFHHITGFVDCDLLRLVPPTTQLPVFQWSQLPAQSAVAFYWESISEQSFLFLGRVHRYSDAITAEFFAEHHQHPRCSRRCHFHSWYQFWSSQRYRPSQISGGATLPLPHESSVMHLDVSQPSQVALREWQFRRWKAMGSISTLLGVAITKLGHFAAR